MNKKLVSFICCPAVVGSYSGMVSSAIKGKVPDFIMYTSNGGFFKPWDLYEVNELIYKINLNKKMTDELLELDKKYGPFEAFADRFYLSDLVKNPIGAIDNLLEMVKTRWIDSIASRVEPIKELQAKLEDKVKEKQKIIKGLRNDLSKSSSEFPDVLKALSEDSISKGPLHVCAEHFYTLVPRYKKLKKDLEDTKNLAKQEKIKRELLEIELAVRSVTHFCIVCELSIANFEPYPFYKQFLRLSEVQRKKILNLIELEENIEKIYSLLKSWISGEHHSTIDSNIYSAVYPHIVPQVANFTKHPENGKNTVIERADIIYNGLLKIRAVAKKNETIKKRTEEFEEKYPGVFFPWQEIPDNDLVKKLTDLKYDKDLDKKYVVKNPQSEDLLEKLRNQEAECSDRIANIRECIPNKDFEEGKDLDSYIKELIMLYQAREAVRAEIKTEIDIRELFEVLAFNVSQ